MEKIIYEDIAKANETIKTTDIKGKEYAEVNQRIKAFRMLYPQGVIETEMISNENGICIFKAFVGYREGNELYKLATGTAYEKENSTFINKTSYIENCETSAVGRALGMAGFGIDTSVASAEEVQNAIANQESTKSKTTIFATPKQIELINSLEIDTKKMYKYYGIKKTEELTIEQADEIIKKKMKQQEDVDSNGWMQMQE
ncbi:MAG: hypothetical protein IJL74_04780 [Bacilli bacterium]|nr:hypothetical protein [Bacilli bacterium]